MKEIEAAKDKSPTEEGDALANGNKQDDIEKEKAE